MVQVWNLQLISTSRWSDFAVHFRRLLRVYGTASLTTKLHVMGEFVISHKKCYGPQCRCRIPACRRRIRAGQNLSDKKRLQTLHQTNLLQRDTSTPPSHLYTGENDWRIWGRSYGTQNSTQSCQRLFKTIHAHPSNPTPTYNVFKKSVAPAWNTLTTKCGCVFETFHL